MIIPGLFSLPDKGDKKCVCNSCKIIHHNFIFLCVLECFFFQPPALERSTENVFVSFSESTLNDNFILSLVAVELYSIETTPHTLV